MTRRWRSSAWTAAAVGAWLLSLQLASGQDATSACQQHHRTHADTMDVSFYTGSRGQDFGAIRAKSPAGRKLNSVIRFHFISIVEESEAWSYLCVGIFDTTSYTELNPQNERNSVAYITLHTRSQLPAGVVRVNTKCWRENKLFEGCSPQFKPMDYVKNLPQYKYSPLEENFWTNMTTKSLGVDPNWIWKINSRSNRGSIDSKWLSRMDIQSLEELEILGNDWRRPKKLLNHLPLLKKLDFGYNNLEIVPNGTFSNTPNLLNIILGHNNISLFPTEVRHLRKLHLLDLTNPLGNATLRITDEDVKNIPPSTKIIGLEHTKLKVNVSSLFLKHGLGFLNLSGCALGHVGEMDIQNVTNITLYLLDLSFNQLETVPSNFFNKTPNLEYLFLNNNKLKFWNQELLITNKLSKLVLRGNIIENITEVSFKNLGKLEHLDLSHNKVRVLPPETFKEVPGINTLDLSHNNISYLPKELFNYTSKLTTINLSHNRIAKPPHLWSLLIKRLDLSHNILKYFVKGRSKIEEIDLSFNLIKILDVNDIKILNISYNSLRYISPQMWKNITNLEKVDLGGQDFDCCLFGNKSYFKTKIHTEMLTLGTEKDLTCSINKTSQILLKTFSYKEAECNPKTVGRTAHAFGVEVVLPVSVLVVAIVVVAVMTYVYRFELIYVSHLFRMKKVGAEADEERYKTSVYDAFVCYSAKNFDWVLETLLPGLEEGGESYRLCVHDRDFALGAGINRNIVASLDKSRKVILVLSRDFIASRWCQWELEMANHKMFEERRNFIILVELERLERGALPRHLRYLMARTTYLEWPTPEEAASGAKWQRRTQACFQRLRDALGDSLRVRNGDDKKRAFTVLDA